MRVYSVVIPTEHRLGRHEMSVPFPCPDRAGTSNIERHQGDEEIGPNQHYASGPLVWRWPQQMNGPFSLLSAAEWAIHLGGVAASKEAYHL